MPRLIFPTLALALFPLAASAGMTLTSTDLTEGGTMPAAQVFNGFGCSGLNLSPSLEWSGAPDGTKSFILTAYDPDAPTGSGWWHWTVVNIPADAHALPEGASPKALPAGAIEARTDFGDAGYGGACPPEGDKPHRYIFTLYAMPVEAVPLDAGASGAMVGYMANGGALEKATLTVTYGR
ncbi:YbhB/YbcL family Raf kinase inhibitor-like protein [Tabrizicola sp. J26]|uniref:YbhB/YbcL family Raf kinase inhibitor-like protein n=1 Tax=Alitabrizicola rongguiensis TaxID=2909234 RepID=UPI001F317D74|nr:YbhB/YbcL family Raf kinase inhibitor-like protein [Tabrizicola rongguiensis]MCF1707212.1 YbhB/YbcL family Raf kinase inhibitor-like protein [Tabrizicola rongguiensis]